MNKSDSVVIIPTYNEKENIENIINAVFALPVMFDVLIIDDNSPDGTAAIVERMQKQWDGRLHLLKRSGKLGGQRKIPRLYNSRDIIASMLEINKQSKK